MSRGVRIVLAVMVVLALTLTLVGTALADNPHPDGSGQPSQSCQNPATLTTPGNAASAPGSAFNPGGVAGGVYNPGSQYDVACFQNSQPHP